MIRVFLAVFFVVLLSFCSNAQKMSGTSSPRKTLNLNTNWAFYRGDASGAEQVEFKDEHWSSISIPHVMRLEKKHNGGNAIYQGIGWYRRYFRVGKQECRKRITLQFDGVK